MTVSQWIYDRVINSTNVNSVISTRCYPEFTPNNSNIPCVVYQQLSYSRNRLEKMPIYQIKGIHNTKADIEDLNERLYSLFDNSTSQIREASSNLYIDTVNIINNLSGVYDSDNKKWFCIVDVNIIYHN